MFEYLVIFGFTLETDLMNETISNQFKKKSITNTKLNNKRRIDNVLVNFSVIFHTSS